MKITAFAVFAAALFAANAAFAADADKKEPEKHTLTLKTGKVLQNAYILDKKPNGITLGYKDGCMFVPFSDMPLEYQLMFGYDAIKSARYERKLGDLKKLAAREEEARQARAQKYNAMENKRYKDNRINLQIQKVLRLEKELEEAKKRLDAAEKTDGRDRTDIGMSSIGTSQATIESLWGYGGRISTGKHNAAVTNMLMKEVDSGKVKRDKQAQDVNDLELKLEAAQRTLDALLEKSS